jgi:hypothetical protein
MSSQWATSIARGFRFESLKPTGAPAKSSRCRDENPIRKSGYRFSEKITLEQQAQSEIPVQPKSFRFK